jgi:YidC/Oxa1 family membrane protein insertase
MSLRKVFVLPKNGFVIRLKLEISNSDAQAWRLPKSYLLWGPNVGAMVGGMMEINQGGAIQSEGKLSRMSLGDDEIQQQKSPHWVAVKNHYFVAAFISDGAFPEAELRGVERGVTKTVTAALGLGELQIKPGETRVMETRLYAGPQDYATLKSFDNNLQSVVQFTFQWLSPLSVFLLSIMKFLYGFTLNWGFAIIMLTLVVKAALFYPTHKGMVASKRMQVQMAKMAPVLASLKQTYKNDPSKLQQETMRLYKEHGVNPLSGCLLMLPQMFIMIALYGALNGAFELRGAAFLGPWIDLSAPDPTYLLVPIMGASMWLQQKMTPMNTATMSEEQAQMQKMMMTMMPIMFTVRGFIFKWPTGLLLYWSVSNFFGIGQQWYVNRTVK